MTFFTGPWPDGRRGAFALSFDCDVAYAYTANVRPQNPPPSGDDLLAKQPRTLSALSRGYYGLHVGLPRILAFLERRGLRKEFSYVETLFTPDEEEDAFSPDDGSDSEDGYL
ncbi:MAG: hypothetical protein QF582_17315 [Alphaproteobacteria bacterium]|nr:hypothetical protein [Alphaproteobacteria bacterium]